MLEKLLLALCLAAPAAVVCRDTSYAEWRCDGMSVPNGVVRCAGSSCFLRCDYGFSPVRFFRFDCAAAESLWGSHDDDDGQNGDEDSGDGCAANMAFVVGGMNGRDSYTSNVEIVSTDSALSQRSVAPFPYAVESPVAVWANGTVLVCGGYNHDDDKLERSCYMYEACRNEWEDAPDLSETRVGAVGVVTSDDEYWILGGENEDGESLDSSQIWRIGMRQWESGPNLQEGRMGHCGVVVDGGDTSVITGGDPTYNSVELFRGDDDSGHGTQTALGFKRTYHACSNYLNPANGEETIIVAGGQDNEGTPSFTVEVWNEEYGQWDEFQHLPQSLTGPGMAVLDGRVAVLGGRSMLSAPSAAVYALKDDGSDWESIGVEMGEGRAFAGVATVPETLFDYCGGGGVFAGKN